jgi:hypothetical protein
MTLYCKRAKCFVDQTEGTKKFLLQAGPSPVPVPFWVARTRTFEDGIKDKSIINLTEPGAMKRGLAALDRKPEPAPEPLPAVAEDEVEVEEPTETDEAVEAEPEEQTEVPQAPFGAQPMTPVSPAPKIGRVRAGNARG